jgi:nitrogen fixation-related uncharacterized protein
MNTVKLVATIALTPIIAPIAIVIAAFGMTHFLLFDKSGQDNDRFSDTAIYSSDPAIDPLAAR